MKRAGLLGQRGLAVKWSQTIEFLVKQSVRSYGQTDMLAWQVPTSYPGCSRLKETSLVKWDENAYMSLPLASGAYILLLQAD